MIRLELVDEGSEAGPDEDLERGQRSPTWAKTWAELDRDLAVELAELYGSPFTGEEIPHATVDQVLRGAGSPSWTDGAQKVKASEPATSEALKLANWKANMRFTISDCSECDERDPSERFCKCAKSLPQFDMISKCKQDACMTRKKPFSTDLIQGELTRCIGALLALVAGAEVTLEKISTIAAADVSLCKLVDICEAMSLEDEAGQIPESTEFARLISSELSFHVGLIRRFLKFVVEEAKKECVVKDNVPHLPEPKGARVRTNAGKLPLLRRQVFDAEGRIWECSAYSEKELQRRVDEVRVGTVANPEFEVKS